jgi:hypothetical protein
VIGVLATNYQVKELRSCWIGFFWQLLNFLVVLLYLNLHFGLYTLFFSFSYKNIISMIMIIIYNHYNFYKPQIKIKKTIKIKLSEN